jgi:transcriptional regulator with GAF, ATPase, and Fis domain
MSATFFVNPRANPELKSLYEIALLPQPQTHLQDYFNKVMEILAQYFPIGYSALLLLQDHQKDSLQLEALYGVGKENHPQGCNGQKGIVGKVIDSQRPLVIHNLSQEPLYEEVAKGIRKIEKVRAPLLCVPLVYGEETIGVVNINSIYGPRHEFTEDIQYLSTLSAVLAPVIKHYQVKKNEALQKAGKIKSKTPLLDELLEEKLAEVLNKIDPYVESNAKMGVYDDIISVVEKILIKSALRRVGHVQIAAAQFLGINRNTLRKKMKELKIKSP